jgi:hypothetical protein
MFAFFFYLIESSKKKTYKIFSQMFKEHLYILVRVPGYRSRGLGFNSRRYYIFWAVVALERGPLSLVSTVEELLGGKSSGFGPETREYGRGDPLCWAHDSLLIRKSWH